MTAPGLWYGLAHKAAYDALLALGTPKMMLLADTYAPAQDTDQYVDDLSADEIAAGSGYTSGGNTLTSVTTALDTGTNTVNIDADDITGLSVSACYAALVVDTGTDATSPVVGYWDLSDGGGSDVSVTGLAFDTGGLLAVVVS